MMHLHILWLVQYLQIVGGEGTCRLGQFLLDAQKCLILHCTPQLSGLEAEEFREWLCEVCQGAGELSHSVHHDKKVL